jgi:methyl-accepting chemotaxis protein
MRGQWTVGKRLGAGFGLALLLLVLIAGVSYWSLSRLVDSASWVAHTHEVLENLEGVLSLLKDAETGQRGFLVTGQERFLDPYHKALKDLPEKLAKVRTLTSDNKTQQERLDSLKPRIDERLQEIKNTMDSFNKEDRQGAASGAKAKASDALMKRLQHGKDLMDNIREHVGQMEQEERRLLKERSDMEKGSVLAARLTILFGSLAALLSLSLTGVLITRGITRPLRSVTEMSQEIAAGNLKQEKLRVTSGDEIGQLAGAFNGMLEGLRGLARQTHAVTGSLNAATVQMQTSIQQQAASTREQAATVQQITTTMEEVGQAGAQISAKAKQVATTAEATSAASTSGLQAVRGATQSMGAIREQVEQVAENIVALSEKTQAVGEIIASVNDIAERSNLLALNAAIEAAAAGEQGSRFAVVAAEMKNLADQAKQATVHVRTILGDIQKGINSSVMLTEEAVKRVESGRRQADVTEETIRQMAATTLDSVQAFEQIIGAGNQQQIGFEQVAQGMKDIRQAATQTAAATAQMEKAVANLGTLSRELKEAVGRYQL